MDEGISVGTFATAGSLSHAKPSFKKSVERSKPASRRLHRKKATLGQLRKKCDEEKSGKPDVTSNDIDDERLHYCHGLVSSTSATESATEEYKKKLGVGKKIGKSFIDFAKYEDALKLSTFVFQKRLSRIDWRKLHTIDVDKIVREVDIDTLESLLDTIAFSDIQGEDTRNFTEANFIKIYRLAQLMVEYLLQVQRLLAAQKSQLLADGKTIQRRMEKHKERFGKLLTNLTQGRHDLKQAKKTLRIYEAMLKVQGQNQQQQQMQQQQSVAQQMIRCCPLCDKMFESSYYLDLHVGRRHPKPNDMPEEKILAVVSKAEEVTAARVKAETTAVLQNEIQHLRSMSQAEIQRTEAAAQFQIATLQASLRESNSKVQEVQHKLEQLQAQIQNSALTSASRDAAPVRTNVKDTKTKEKLKELDEQLQGLQKELKNLTQEKTNLMKELASTKSEVSLLKAAGGRNVGAERKDNKQILDLEEHHRSRTYGKVVKIEPLQVKIAEDVETLSSTTSSEIHDRITEDETSSERIEGNRRTRTKHQKNSSASLAKSGEEEKHKVHKKVKSGHSSPARKRKQRFLDDRITLRKPRAATTRRIDSESPSPRQSEDVYETYRITDREANEEHATLSGQFRQWKESLPSRKVPDPKLSDRIRSADKDILGAAKADLELDLARAEEKRFGTQEAGKKTKRESEKTTGRQRPTQEKETMAREKRRLEAEKEKEMERLAKETAEEEEAKRKLEIAAAASMDVGEDGPIIPVAEKEKWLLERPYKPIPQRPHVLSKFPHPPNVFESKRGDLVNRLDEQLVGELRKFGFSSDTEGISDSIHQAAIAALDKQNRHRASVLQTNQKKSLEYEKGAIVWHTQRAVRERDIRIIESHFEEDSDGTSSSSGSEQADSGLTDEEGNEHSTLSHHEKLISKTTTPTAPQIEDEHYGEDQHYNRNIFNEVDLSGGSQPGVSLSNGSAERKHLNYSANSYSRKQMNKFKIQTQNAQGVLFSSQHFRDNSREQLLSKYSPPSSHSKKDAKEEDVEGEKEAEAEFGLGQWDSDEEMHTQVARNDAREDKHTREHFSEDGSEESKIFKELDAEIDEIIRL